MATERTAVTAMSHMGPGRHDPIYPLSSSKSVAFTKTAKSGRGPAIDNGTELEAKIRNVQKKKRN